jgi:asparagine synthase (glutamine-hydrolysing)
LPDNYRIRDGWTKWILRTAGSSSLPEQVRWRTDKLGFATPQASWLAEGAGYIKDLFGSGEILSARFLSSEVIGQLRQFDETVVGRIPGLWRIVNLEVWLRNFVDGPA